MVKGKARSVAVCGLLALAVGSGCSSSPTAPSSFREILEVATTPTPTGGAPLFTLLGNATACAKTYSNDENLVVIPPETHVRSDSEGRFVETPAVGNQCDAPIEVSGFTLELYAARDRVGMPLLTAVQAGPWTVDGRSEELGGCGGYGCSMFPKTF